MPIIINGTTGISGVDGSTGTPALIGSDADTGLLFTAGRVQASLNGTAANVGLVQGTAQASTSGSNIDFTGIPSWAKRITVTFNGVSTSGTSAVQIQLGDAGGIENTGYMGGCSAITTSSAVFLSFTAAFVLNFGADSATTTRHGAVQITNVTGNTWVATGSLASVEINRSVSIAYSKTLSDVLTQVRIGNAGADTFDAGSINIFYE